jgi:hypothetical protein
MLECSNGTRDWDIKWQPCLGSKRILNKIHRQTTKLMILTVGSFIRLLGQYEGAGPPQQNYVGTGNSYPERVGALTILGQTTGIPQKQLLEDKPLRSQKPVEKQWRCQCHYTNLFVTHLLSQKHGHDSMNTHGWIAAKSCLITTDRGASVKIAIPAITGRMPERDLTMLYALQKASAQPLPILKEHLVTMTLEQHPLQLGRLSPNSPISSSWGSTSCMHMMHQWTWGAMCYDWVMKCHCGTLGHDFVQLPAWRAAVI